MNHSSSRLLSNIWLCEEWKRFLLKYRKCKKLEHRKNIQRIQINEKIWIKIWMNGMKATWIVKSFCCCWCCGCFPTSIINFSFTLSFLCTKIKQILSVGSLILLSIALKWKFLYIGWPFSHCDSTNITR